MSDNKDELGVHIYHYPPNTHKSKDVANENPRLCHIMSEMCDDSLLIDHHLLIDLLRWEFSQSDSKHDSNPDSFIDGVGFGREHYHKDVVLFVISSKGSWHEYYICAHPSKIEKIIINQLYKLSNEYTTIKSFIGDLKLQQAIEKSNGD